MSTINIITLIAVILFARLGMRLFFKNKELQEEEKREEKGKKEEENKTK